MWATIWLRSMVRLNLLAPPLPCQQSSSLRTGQIAVVDISHLNRATNPFYVAICRQVPATSNLPRCRALVQTFSKLHWEPCSQKQSATGIDPLWTLLANDKV